MGGGGTEVSAPTPPALAVGDRVIGDHRVLEHIDADDAGTVAQILVADNTMAGRPCALCRVCGDGGAETTCSIDYLMRIDDSDV